ncbi:unnamed protein product [Fusarium graminearum]|uniref:Chromosome 1, complete genome n=1 Tax=Gibberella zeae (strain ATCC MYA-4620 / CBS 123657 / FGSC 9075 / NRRL 31084 / PH-1) TaxID=229533 RepID=I1S5Q4_GIBZE|nr:hypothetical protein FGSG_12175 [Fusarium graminearum PH-1]ESU08112.1 hypothetical protein FGSG_12175 [Fusarium graminearum PH-1]CEF74980.1 unnamed protein product [Fusarium graminearum]CZS78258.1 unnamed protein product [Fusarium graminearum]|eukprot:XP_011318597.1 hypothetical protein FGSG_12175 [Fusarium graminearum PH-1]
MLLIACIAFCAVLCCSVLPLHFIAQPTTTPGITGLNYEPLALEYFESGIDIDRIAVALHILVATIIVADPRNPALILQSTFKMFPTGFRIWHPCTTRHPGATSGL